MWSNYLNVVLMISIPWISKGPPHREIVIRQSAPDTCHVTFVFVREKEMPKAHVVERDSIAKYLSGQRGQPVRLVMLAVKNDSISTRPAVVDSNLAYWICHDYKRSGRQEFCVQRVEAIGVDEPLIVWPEVPGRPDRTGLGYTYVVFPDWAKLLKNDVYDISGNPFSTTPSIGYNPGCCGRGGS